jgi:hypothetical protein
MFVTCECTCTAETEYADGSRPSFYVDEGKATYMWQKLKGKARAGVRRAQTELIFGLDGEVIHRNPPCTFLKDYNFYYGVHLHGLHVLAIKQ